MPDGRPSIPAAIRREALLETGAVCAFPTCRQGPTDFAHIEDYSKVKKHEFANIIVLCVRHHRMHTDRVIDRKLLLQLKMNLAVMNGRYSDLERRVIAAFAANSELEYISLPGGLDLLLWHLLDDGYIAKHANEQLDFMAPQAPLGLSTLMTQRSYLITEKGREFIRQWQAVEPLP